MSMLIQPVLLITKEHVHFAGRTAMGVLLTAEGDNLEGHAVVEEHEVSALLTPSEIVSGAKEHVALSVEVGDAKPCERCFPTA